VKCFFLFLAALMLAGCGPKQEKQVASAPRKEARTPPPETHLASAPDHRPIVVAFGDSLSAGFGADPGDSYPDYLQKLLDRNGYSYRVVNQGISGDTTSGGVTRLDRAIALKPEIVILELGGNDGLRGVPVPDIKANLEKMIVSLKKARIHILLAGITLPPNYGQEYIRPFDEMYRDLAARFRLPLIPFLLKGVFEAGLVQQDGIHPTAKGNEIVAATVFDALKPLLASPARRQPTNANVPKPHA